MTSRPSHQITSRVAALVALGSTTGPLAPFLLQPELRAQWLGKLADAGWAGVVGALAAIAFAYLWVAVVYTSVGRFLGFALAGGFAPAMAHSLFAFLRSGIRGLARHTQCACSEARPLRLAIVAGLAGFGAMTAVDGLIQLATHRLILPPVTPDSALAVSCLFAVLAVLAPALETLIMVATLEAARRVNVGSHVCAVASATAWSIWHGYVNHPAQAPSIFWLFWVLSLLYLHLRSTTNVWRAGVAVMVAHATNNTLALLFVLAKLHLLRG